MSPGTARDMTDSTWNQDTTSHDKDGSAVAPDNSASTGGVQAGDGSHAGTRRQDPHSGGGTEGTTTGDAPYDLDSSGEAGSDAKSPSGT